MCSLAIEAIAGESYIGKHKPGTSVDIRLDNGAIVQRGNSVVAKDIKETYETLTLQDLYSTYVEYDTVDFSTKVGADNWKEQIFLPQVRALVGEINKDIAADAETVSYMHLGTPGTAISTFKTVDTAGAIMFGRGIAPAQPWYLAITAGDATELKASLQNSFNTTLNQEISLQSRLGRLSYFDIMMDQSIAVHQPYKDDVLTASSIQVNAAVSSGSTIVLKGLTASKTGIIKAGDVLEITGVQSVNRITRATTGRNMQFVVQADADSTAGGLATVTVSPTIISDTNNPNQNVTNAVPEDGVVTINGVDGTAIQVNHNINLSYSENGLYIVTPPLAPLDSPDSSVFKDAKSGLSLRVSKDADVANSTNRMRVDILVGYLWIGTQVVRTMS